MIGLCMLLVNLLKKHLRILMIFLSLMLKHSGDEPETSNNVNDDAQPSNDNDIEIEPAVDLDNPQSKNQRYDKRDFIARNTTKKIHFRDDTCLSQ